MHVIGHSVPTSVPAKFASQPCPNEPITTVHPPNPVKAPVASSIHSSAINKLENENKKLNIYLFKIFLPL